MKEMSNTNLTTQETNIEVIKKRIYEIRGQRVMIDRDLAELYGVETRTLNQAVKRNMERFPEDFVFTLTEQELENWKSQICDIQFHKDGASQITISFHRTWHHNAKLRITFRNGHTGQYQYHAGICND